MSLKNAAEWLEEIESVGDGATLGFVAILPAIRDEMRQEIDKAVYAVVARSSYYESDVHRAILNASKAPVLKPGMLVWGQADHTPMEWREGYPSFYNPLTRAECMAYADKAPVSKEDRS